MDKIKNLYKDRNTLANQLSTLRQTPGGKDVAKEFLEQVKNNSGFIYDKINRTLNFYEEGKLTSNGVNNFITLDGYDLNYEYGKNPKIDNLINNLNNLTNGLGGITLSSNGSAILRLSTSLPKDTSDNAKKIVRDILKLMGSPVGLGVEKNKELIENITNGNYEKILDFINEDNKDIVFDFIETLGEKSLNFNKGNRNKIISKIISSAIKNLDTYAYQLKSLIIYYDKYHNQYLKNPFNGEILLIDKGEIISSKGNGGNYYTKKEKGTLVETDFSNLTYKDNKLNNKKSKIEEINVSGDKLIIETVGDKIISIETQDGEKLSIGNLVNFGDYITISEGNKVRKNVGEIYGFDSEKNKKGEEGLLLSVTEYNSDNKDKVINLNKKISEIDKKDNFNEYSLKTIDKNFILNHKFKNSVEISGNRIISVKLFDKVFNIGDEISYQTNNLKLQEGYITGIELSYENYYDNNTQYLKVVTTNGEFYNDNLIKIIKK